MSKTRKAYRLSQRTRYINTRPEQIMRGVLQEVLVPPESYIQNALMPRIEGYDFQVDFLLGVKHPDSLGFRERIVLEVDGPYHDTPKQQQKTRWRDALLVKNLYRIIHVDSDLMANQELRAHLRKELRNAINSEEKVVRICA